MNRNQENKSADGNSPKSEESNFSDEDIILSQIYFGEDTESLSPTRETLSAECLGENLTTCRQDTNDSNMTYCTGSSRFEKHDSVNIFVPGRNTMSPESITRKLTSLGFEKNDAINYTKYLYQAATDLGLAISFDAVMKARRLELEDAANSSPEHQVSSVSNFERGAPESSYMIQEPAINLEQGASASFTHGGLPSPYLGYEASAILNIKPEEIVSSKSGPGVSEILLQETTENSDSSQKKLENTISRLGVSANSNSEQEILENLKNEASENYSLECGAAANSSFKLKPLKFFNLEHKLPTNLNLLPRVPKTDDNRPRVPKTDDNRPRVPKTDDNRPRVPKTDDNRPRVPKTDDFQDRVPRQRAVDYALPSVAIVSEFIKCVKEEFPGIFDGSCALVDNYGIGLLPDMILLDLYSKVKYQWDANRHNYISHQMIEWLFKELIYSVTCLVEDNRIFGINMVYEGSGSDRGLKAVTFADMIQLELAALILGYTFLAFGQHTERRLRKKLAKLHTDSQESEQSQSSQDETARPQLTSHLKNDIDNLRAFIDDLTKTITSLSHIVNVPAKENTNWSKESK